MRQYHIAPADKAIVDTSRNVEDVVFVDEAGNAATIGATDGSGYELPAAGETVLGGVRQANVGSTSGTADSAISDAVATPTKDEYDALAHAHNELARQFNLLITSLTNSGVLKRG